MDLANPAMLIVLCALMGQHALNVKILMQFHQVLAVNVQKDIINHLIFLIVMLARPAILNAKLAKNIQNAYHVFQGSQNLKQILSAIA